MPYQLLLVFAYSVSMQKSKQNAFTFVLVKLSSVVHFGECLSGGQRSPEVNM